MKLTNATEQAVAIVAILRHNRMRLLSHLKQFIVNYLFHSLT